MADARMSRSAMFAALPDNVTGLITPQTARDVALTNIPDGISWHADPAELPLTVEPGGVLNWVPLAVVTITEFADSWSNPAPGAFQYDGTVPREASGISVYNFQGTQNNTLYQTRTLVNGTPIVGSETTIQVPTGDLNVEIVHAIKGHVTGAELFTSRSPSWIRAGTTTSTWCITKVGYEGWRATDG